MFQKTLIKNTDLQRLEPFWYYPNGAYQPLSKALVVAQVQRRQRPVLEQEIREMPGARVSDAVALKVGRHTPGQMSPMD
jgi:hypothetical protein